MRVVESWNSYHDNKAAKYSKCWIAQTTDLGTPVFKLGRDVLLEIWKCTHIYTNFLRKSDPFKYQSAQFWTKFSQKLANFPKIWPTFGSDLENFENRPIQIPNSAFYLTRGHWFTRRLILLPMFAAHPRRVFFFLYWAPTNGSWTGGN